MIDMKAFMQDMSYHVENDDDPIVSFKYEASDEYPIVWYKGSMYYESHGGEIFVTTDLDSLDYKRPTNVPDKVREYFKEPKVPELSEGEVIDHALNLMPGNAEKTFKLIRDQDPKLVDLFIKIAGRHARKWLENNGRGVPPSDRICLYNYPRFKDLMFAANSRYADSLEELMYPNKEDK